MVTWLLSFSKRFAVETAAARGGGGVSHQEQEGEMGHPQPEGGKPRGGPAGVASGPPPKPALKWEEGMPAGGTHCRVGTAAAV